jgi:hypothetical protein
LARIRRARTRPPSESVTYFLANPCPRLLHILTHLPQFGPPQWPLMARPQKRKRQRVDEPPQDQVPSKKAKPSSVFSTRWQNRKSRADNPPQDQISSEKPELGDALHRASNFPPDFYDNLSKVWLTRRALQEHNRRNENHTPSKPAARLVRSRKAKLAALVRLGVPELTLFASSGGPDLSDLQGVICLYFQSPAVVN